jgi:peptidoglycan hydrolase-like protein with peptidoglycan-binding domain
MGSCSKARRDAGGMIQTQVPLGASGGTLTFLGKNADGSESELWAIELTFAPLLGAQTVEGAQKRLSNVGLFPGREDGNQDETTTRAIRRFQELDHIQPENGELDAQTAARLRDYYGS